ncbi:MAG: rod shape-determining protein MreD [Gammaproteobacteria bacterium]|nr:MAG: rod shape-determining protein MreD [Gammaproteobacteria bacterium]
MSAEDSAGGRACRPAIIPVSLLVALLLTLLPLPEWAAVMRPLWVPMVLLYWVMALPQRVGLGWAWSMGLLLDVAKGAVLGQHALALVIAAWITLRLHQRIRVAPLYQQAISIALILLLYLLITFVIAGFLGDAPRSSLYWLPLFTSALLWPWLFILLRDLRRRCRLSQ